MCNAWMHGAGCDCGFGGGYHGGGGYRAGLGRSFSSERIRSIYADGNVWKTGTPAYSSFVDPNALCPVCGAEVFFYQSPYGGRVFFDELGPPWPKHPCTDNGREVLRSERSTSAPEGNPILKYGRYQWRPFKYGMHARSEHNTDVADVSSSNEFEPVVLFLPQNSMGVSPIFWRWSRDKHGFIEISIMMDTERRFLVPVFIRQLGEFLRLRSENFKITPKNWSSIIHIARGVGRLVTSKGGDAGEHYAAAIAAIEQALAAYPDYEDVAIWLYILGCLYRDGFGCEVDLNKAFEYLSRSVEKTSYRSLVEDLAEFYERGWGTSPDPEYAKFLRDLAKTLPDW